MSHGGDAAPLNGNEDGEAVETFVRRGDGVGGFHRCPLCRRLFWGAVVCPACYLTRTFWCLVLRHSCRQGSAAAVIRSSTAVQIARTDRERFGKRWRRRVAARLARRYGGVTHVLWRGVLQEKAELLRRRDAGSGHDSSDDESSGVSHGSRYSYESGRWHVNFDSGSNYDPS